MLKPGDPAPDFVLQSDEGASVELKQFRGRKVVLYFYPKDDTPGCTAEACGFRDAYDAILAKNAAVIGVSADGADSHRRFRGKHGLPFFLLSDPGRKVLSAYESWGNKKIGGKLISGLLRKTYIIDEDGKILKIFPKVNPAGHAGEILALL